LSPPRLDDAERITLYRAVGLNEATDIRSFGGFRVGPGSAFVEGKWFATSSEHAEDWGRRMPPIGRPRPFLVASVDVPLHLLAELDRVDRLDGIGPAYFVRHDQLPLINAAGPINLSVAISAWSTPNDPTV
jgi:hypothetical protein